MVYAVHDRHVFEIERAHLVEASDIDAILVGIRSPLVMFVDTTMRAKEVLRRACVEAVASQDVLSLQNAAPAHLRRHDDSAAHSAIGTGAAADGEVVKSTAQNKSREACSLTLWTTPTINNRLIY